jgi:nucleotide-binding universal stress UspA family protein
LQGVGAADRKAADVCSSDLGTLQSAHSRVGPNIWSDFTRPKGGKAQAEVDSSTGAGAAPLDILVPFDFTNSSGAALGCAVRMAGNGKAKITLLHAIHLNLAPYGPANLALIKRDLRRQARARLRAAGAPARGRSISVDSAIQEGKPSAVIEQYIREHEVDLVIIGRHRHRRLGWFVRQNVAEKVVRCARCPVLVLQEDESTPL